MTTIMDRANPQQTRSRISTFPFYRAIINITEKVNEKQASIKSWTPYYPYYYFYYHYYHYWNIGILYQNAEILQKAIIGRCYNGG